MNRQDDCIPLTCVRSLERELSEAVRNNDSDQIKRIVHEDPNLLCHEYSEYDGTTILEAACANEEFAEVRPDTISLLIKLGANLEQPNEAYDDKRAIHFAADTMNCDILKAVLDGMDENNANFNLLTSYRGHTALMNLLENSDNYTHKDFLKCVELLANKLDVNYTDNNGIPPVYIAASNGLEDVVDILKANSDQLDVDTYKDSKKKTARDLIVEKKWYLSSDFPNYKYTDTNSVAHKLNSNQLTEDDLDGLQDVNAEYRQGTLLQMLVKRSLVGLVRKLLENKKVDCNKTTIGNKIPPIKIALERGDYKTLTVLLRDTRTAIPNNLVCHALSKFGRVAPYINGNYNQCASACIEEKRAQHLINKTDEKGNHPLHYACRYSDEPTILGLLDKKASLANCSTNGYLSTNDIRKKTLEAHLDSCLDIHETKARSFGEEKEVRFDFTTLLPTDELSSDSKPIQIEIPTKNGNSTTQYQGNELDNRRERIEMAVPLFMSRSVELKPLLTHPIMAMFINLKWQQVNRIYYFNLIFYIALCVLLYAYIFLNYINEDYKDYATGIQLISGILYVLNIVSLVVLMLREFFQIWLEKMKYFKNIENYIELTLICTMLVIVLPILIDDYPARKQVASIAILFSAMELFLLFGKQPNLSTNIVILRTVSLTFFKLLLWYSILIGAFALSFYALFSGEEMDGNDPNLFANPGLAAIKTIVMLTGEFDAGNIKFDSIPIISHLIFLMFVFMISMVLLNLMNGLAVTDTHVIKNESELYSYVSQIQYIAYIEGLLTDHQLSKYLKRLCKTSFFARVGPNVVMSVPLYQDKKSVGHFLGNVDEKVTVRQSLVKRAKAIVEERNEAKKTQNSESERFKRMENMLLQQMSQKFEEISKKIEALSRNDN